MSGPPWGQRINTLALSRDNHHTDQEARGQQTGSRPGVPDGHAATHLSLTRNKTCLKCELVGGGEQINST